MKMIRDKTNTFKLLMFAMTVILAAVGLSFIPWDQQIAVHWSVSNEPDNFLPAYIAFAIPPMLCLFIFGLQLLSARLLGAEEIEAASASYRMGMSLVFVVALFVQAVILSQALGWDVDPIRAAVILIGFVLIALGNYLPKSRRNKIAGIRVSSTMDSEENWIRTHHFAGKVYMLTGLIAVIVGLTGVPTPLNLVIAIVCGIVPEVAAILFSRSIRQQTEG